MTWFQGPQRQDPSAIMAQMVAGSRPQFAGSGGGGGGYGGVPATGTHRQVSVNASAGIQALKQLFGYKTPEEKEKIGQNIVQMRQSIEDDEQWQAYASKEMPQKFMKAAYEAGVPGIYPNEKTGQMDVLKVPPSTKIAQGKLTQEQVGMMPGKEWEPYRKTGIETERATKAPYPEEVEMQREQIATQKMVQENLGKEMELKRQELGLKQQETAARLQEARAQTGYYESRSQLDKLAHTREERMQMQAENNAIKEADSNFSNAINDIDANFIKDVELSKRTPENQYAKLKAKASAVMQHITTVNRVTPDTRAAESSVRYWFSEADEEVNQPTAITEKQAGVGLLRRALPGQGAPPPGKQFAMEDEVIQQQIRRRSYVKIGADMLRTTGPTSPDLYRQLLSWSVTAGYKPQQGIEILRQAAPTLTNEQLSAVIDQAMEYERTLGR